MPKDLYNTTPATTPDAPDRGAVARVYGEDAANQLFNKDKIAGALYPTTPAAPPSAEWYPLERNIATDLDQDYRKLEPRLRLSAEAQATERANYVGMLKRLGLDKDAGFAVMLHNKLTNARLAEARPEVDPPTLDTEVRQRSEETYSRLRQRWGKEFDPLLARVTRYVAADAELDAALGSGPGSDYDVVNGLFEHIQRSGYR